MSYPDTIDEAQSRLQELRHLMDSEQVVQSDWIKYAGFNVRYNPGHQPQGLIVASDDSSKTEQIGYLS